MALHPYVFPCVSPKIKNLLSHTHSVVSESGNSSLIEYHHPITKGSKDVTVEFSPGLGSKPEAHIIFGLQFSSVSFNFTSLLAFLAFGFVWLCVLHDSDILEGHIEVATNEV